jgi:hypothetical protein
MVQVAFVISDVALDIDAIELAQRLKVQFSIERIEALPPEAGSSILQITIDGVIVMIAPMGVGYPASDLESLPHVSRRGWNGKTPDYQSRDHAIVTTFGARSEKEAAAMLTVVTAGLCAAPTCKGVVWGNSGEFLHPATLPQYARDALGAEPPIAMWVNTLPYRTRDGIGLTTRGLATFVGRELHFVPHRDHSAEDLIGRGVDFSTYLFEQGLVLLDKQSVGYSKTDKLRVRWTEENVDGEDEPIKWIELHVEALDRN